MSDNVERCLVCGGELDGCTCNQPEDENLVTSDRTKFYRFGFEHKGPCVVVDDGADWQDAVKRYMEKTQFWPNVWLSEERGGYTNITMEGP